MFYLYVAYYVIMNIIAFVVYGVDKKKAINHQWRVPEIVLLSLAFFGGALGAFIAMRVFRHKTKHGLFCFGVPIMLLIHGCLSLYLFEKGMIPFSF